MANKIYMQAETPIIFADAAHASEDYVITLSALAADGVRVSAQGDLSDVPRSEWYNWRLFIDGFNTAPVVGETVDVYLATSDSSGAGTEDGDVGIADAAGSTVQLPNLLYLGSATVQTTTTTDELMVSGTVRITARYVSVVVHNNTADALETSTHSFTLTPVPPEVQ